MRRSAPASREPEPCRSRVSQYGVHLSRTPADGAFPMSSAPSLPKKQRLRLQTEAPGGYHDGQPFFPPPRSVTGRAMCSGSENARTKGDFSKTRTRRAPLRPRGRTHRASSSTEMLGYAACLACATLSGIWGIAGSENCGAVTGSGDDLDSLTVDRKPHGFTGAVALIIGVLESISVNPGGPMTHGTHQYRCNLKLDHC